MAAAGVLGVVLGIKRIGGREGLTDPATLVPLLVGAALVVLFVRRQKRRTHPLIDIAMFSRPAFSTAVGCIVLAMLALVGLELIAVQYLQLVLDLSPLETGLRLLPLTFAAMAAGATGSYTLSRVGPRRMVGWGFVLTAASVLLLTLMGQHDRPVLLTAGFVLLGFGLQSTLFGAYESMLSEVPAERAGGAAAIGETSYQLGAGMGIALLGSVMNAAYAPGLSRVHEEGVPPAAGSAASHSLGEAYQVAARLRRPAGRPAAEHRPARLRRRSPPHAAGQRRPAAARGAGGAATAAGHGLHRGEAGLRGPDRRGAGAGRRTPRGTSRPGARRSGAAAGPPPSRREPAEVTGSGRAAR